MARRSKSDRDKKLVRKLVDERGRTFAEEVGISMRRPGPAAFFQLLCASTLFSARISADAAARAARTLKRKGWTTPRKMADSTWAERTRVLDRSSYARYDERTSRMLGDTAAQVLERYGGDLRKLRDEAGRDPRKEKKLLRRFKGIGPVGADIFLREAQVAWRENEPYADPIVRRSARALGLPGDPERLAAVSGRRAYPRLAAALVRTHLAKDARRFREAAAR